MRENRPVIALDFPTFEDVKAFLAKFPAGEKLYVKIGMELYYAAGPEIVRYVKELGHSVFLDLKLHDIPNTVKSAMRVLSNLGVDMTLAGLMGAIGLAIGIGLQNVPEGAALSTPIRADGKSRIKAFYWGSMSAIVEPIGAVMGAALVMWMMAIIPYALAFAAGAMIFVVTEELIPESQTNGNTDVATLGLMVGFVVMMVMDVALG